MTRVKDGFLVEVLCKIKVPFVFCYKVKLINDTENTVSYDMHKLISQHGDNVIGIDPNFTQDSVGLLISGEIEAGQEVEGLIAFQKNMNVTNFPRIFYEDTIIVG
jgi:hypothetical protein